APLGKDCIGGELAHPSACADVPTGVATEQGIGIVVRPLTTQKPASGIVVSAEYLGDEGFAVEFVARCERRSLRAEAAQRLEQWRGRAREAQRLIGATYGEMAIAEYIGNAPETPRVRGAAAQCGQIGVVASELAL